MTRRTLAEELRSRQRESGFLPPQVLDSLSDDQMIEAYFTCSRCGAKELEDEALNLLIDQSTSAEDLFDRVAAAR